MKCLLLESNQDCPGRNRESYPLNEGSKEGSEPDLNRQHAIYGNAVLPIELPEQIDLQSLLRVNGVRVKCIMKNVTGKGLAKSSVQM